MSGKEQVKVIHHGDCADGVLSAVLFYNYVKHFEDDKSLHIHNIKGLSYQEAESTFDMESLKGNHVAILDFSFKKERTNKLLDMLDNKEILSLTIIDHHKTFLELLEEPEIKNRLNSMENDNLFIKMDMKKSGSGLVYDYIFDKLSLRFDMDMDKYKKDLFDNYPLVKYIQDKDIWTNLYPDSDAVHKGFTNFILDKKNSFSDIVNKLDTINIVFDLLKNNNEIFAFCEIGNNNEIASFKETGDAIIAEIKNKVNYYFDEKQPFSVDINDETFTGFMVKINPNDKYIINDLGNKIYTQDKNPIALIYYDDSEIIRCSFRSAENVDSSAIAKHFGGGGHKCACACFFDNILDFSSHFKIESKTKKLKFK